MSRHRTDLLSLAFGLCFAAVGLVLLSGSSGALSLAWVGPIVAIVLGGLLVLAARSTRTPSEADGAPED